MISDSVTINIEDELEYIELSHVTNNFISPAITITDEELACYHAVNFVLASHRKLNNENIKYACDYICSFYSSSCNLLDEELRNILFTNELLIQFLVYANLTGIAKFAITFNKELDNAIKSQNNTALHNLLLGTNEMFVELYNNILLTRTERDFIIRLVSREIFAMNLYFNIVKNKIMNCTAYEKYDDIDLRDKEILDICYEEVCMQDGRILDNDYTESLISIYEKIPNDFMMLDNGKIYKFDLFKILDTIESGNNLNHITNTLLSEKSLKSIYNRFAKEIKMYKRYKQINK